MNGLFEAMMKKVINNEPPVDTSGEKFEPQIPEDVDTEFVAYLIKAHDKGIYSTERGQRGFIVRRADEVVDAETIIELGKFNAKPSEAFMIASEKFAEQVKAWMEGE